MRYFSLMILISQMIQSQQHPFVESCGSLKGSFNPKIFLKLVMTITFENSQLVKEIINLMSCTQTDKKFLNKLKFVLFPE